MRGTLRVSLCLAAVLVLITAGVASAQITIPIAEEQVMYEITLVQVANPETNAKKAEPLLS